MMEVAVEEDSVTVVKALDPSLSESEEHIANSIDNAKKIIIPVKQPFFI